MFVTGCYRFPVTVSVNIPGAYILGIDTDGDGEADVTAEEAAEAVSGSLVINEEGSVTSSHGVTYTAASAPVIFNTGAAGYGSQQNSSAPGTYAQEGYINVTCGNRGKQDSYETEEGEVVYTGDAPDCLTDQKTAARFVKYNMLLGNLPGNPDYFVATGGSGGGAHAVMFASTGNEEDYYDYLLETGAVGVYQAEDGSWVDTVTIDGEEVSLDDGAWGVIAYSPITSLAEADLAMAFEYNLDASYAFGSDFQKELASLMSQAYMEDINSRNLEAVEADYHIDLNGDGDLDDTVALTIEYDPADTSAANGYSGTYLELYQHLFEQNLQEYVNGLAYAQDWTWFDADGQPLSDEATAQLTAEEKTAAFLEGRYAKTSTGKAGPGAGGAMNGAGGNGFGPDGMGKGGKNDQLPEDFDRMDESAIEHGEFPDGEFNDAGFPNDNSTDRPFRDGFGGNDLPQGDLPGEEGAVGEMIVGTPDAGTTQSASGSTDSRNYSTYAEMIEAYTQDIQDIEAGDTYGNNQVDLYNPLLYIGDEDGTNLVWARMVSGAAEGDISMLNSLNLSLVMNAQGVDTQLEWQWDGGHVPSEIFGNSLSLYVDQMYQTHVLNEEPVQKTAAQVQTTNGSAESPNGTDISSWAVVDEEGASIALADIAAYRTAHASKAVPGFDVIDNGQEDYVFGNETQDARHWNRALLEILKANEEVLAPLFNQNNAS